ncbi:unnamed protein product [Paramecium sonneborni]|uniref:RING-type domain-containing protein n=1 Tax=Paramecium sonneborni TaxID=65129 RepID=A0A8S1RD15_9CILI|nr:unnamed protein product [Paramecium sonneborni]
MIRERQFEVIKTFQVNQHLFCSICREVFYHPIRATCGHTFCGTCLVRWIQMKKSCPLCRHRLERNYQFDKDILATNLVDDIEVKCLRCQLWEGTMAQFKQHKKSQCTYISMNNQIYQDVIEIGDDDVQFTDAGLAEENDTLAQQQILENIGQTNLSQIQQIQIQDQQQQPQLNQNIITNLIDSPLQTNINNNQLPDQFNKQNNNHQIDAHNLQTNVDNIDNNQITIQNDKDNQVNLLFVQEILNNLNNTLNQDELNTTQKNQFNTQYQQVINQLPDSNLEEIQEKQLEVPNQSLVLENNLDQNQSNIINNNEAILQQAQVEKVGDNLQNPIQTDIQVEDRNQINQCLEQSKINQPDVEIIDPPIKLFNNKDLKQIKFTNKFKINILKNNVKIGEPMMEQINNNLFFEFVNHMKKEMVKKLSDIQYYNNFLLG